MKDPENRNKQRAEHILKACKKIEAYVKDVNRAEFLENPVIHDSVLYQFLIIGEAVVHIDFQILDKYPYPWYKVRAFRNLIAHQYFNIEIWTVWEITQKDVAGLKRTIEQMLANEF